MSNAQSHLSDFDRADVVRSDDSTSASAASDPAITAGAALRQAREATGLHIAALAVALKVPVKKLEALEADQYDQLPDMVFARALASSVCRNLKMDASAVLALLPQSAASTYRPPAATAPASYSAYPANSRSRHRLSVSGPAWVAGLMLVAGAAVLVFLPAIKQAMADLADRDLTSDNLLGAISDAKIGLSAGDKPADPAILQSPDTVAARASSLETIAPQLSSATALSSAPAASTDNTGSLTQGTQLSAAERLVTFSTADQPSWVKVTDAKGAVVLSRTIAPGETVAAAGALPLTVVVGRADATRVQVRGQAFDLAAYSRENVARFEVK